MKRRSLRKSVSDILHDSSMISENIKLNAERIGRYGIDVPAFTAAMDAALIKAQELVHKQKQMMSALKMTSLELNEVMIKIEKDYALAKKTVKLAESQLKWGAYGISDKK